MAAGYKKIKITKSRIKLNLIYNNRFYFIIHTIQYSDAGMHLYADLY